MVFAVSFQAKHPGEKDSIYNSRIGLSSKVANQIKLGGGKLLPNGFDQLFEFGAIKNAEVASSTPPPDEEIKLTAAARAHGFTALIADGHSRKVKYMQALALGLPCIHERWITTCTEKQRLVNWSDYLLCAGNSSFLGDAIRSRNLRIYDAASAKLGEVIDSRPRLLRGSRILLVLRKQDERKKEAYIFLARVLGASLSRVYTVDEARKQLKASEDAGHPYDWVYVEEKMAGRAALFADDTTSSSTAPAASRKRKRKSAADAANPAPKKIRTLSNELVIQSLILGRLIEEDEDIG
ncbi:putative family decarboxylase [Diaporthe ampelina]|uniref:Putative family decarboxylase n=1 Tax=Diaporthe ampelina TaxID=1214573 RepID=A0A0G2FBI2_9PEZI|nr:putative family decarboxylase [Diaporthe ampelina]